MSPQRLSRAGLFAGLSENDLDRVAAIMTPHSLASGEDLLREGEEGGEMFVLLKGRVRVSKNMLLDGVRNTRLGLDDTRKTLAVLDGEACPVFGEVALIDEDRRSATVTALEDCDFLRTDREAFFGLMDKHPELGRDLLLRIARTLAATVRKANAETAKLSTALVLALSLE